MPAPPSRGVSILKLLDSGTKPTEYTYLLPEERVRKRQRAKEPSEDLHRKSPDLGPD